MLLQQRGSHGQIAVGFEGFAGTRKMLSVITQVDLPKPGIDPLGVIPSKRLKQGLTGGLTIGETVRAAGNIQRPGPGQQSTTEAGATLLQGNREQHRGRDVGVMRCQLISRRRKFVCPNGVHRQQ